jgi:hypothetical protein
LRRFALFAALVAALIALPSTAAAFTLKPIGTFDEPISITSNPAHADDLLIGERAGRVIEISPAGKTELVDLTSLVSCCDSERGLLSIAPAPDFDSSRRLYIAYTGTPAAGGAEGDVHVDSFRPDPANPTQVLREPILTVEHSAQANHNGGELQFGPDGHLYIGLGDGGGVGDPLGNGQNTEVLEGKILRIDPQPGQTPSYTVPTDNPFVAGPGRDEIWAYGLRNPWRFSFDRLSGDMVIGDVGQGSREEVDFAPSPAPGVVGGGGANYGWNCREGTIAYTEPSQPCDGGGFTEPVFDYVHQNPQPGAPFGCSIIGGYVVRDASVPDLYGRYIYADFCVGLIHSLILPTPPATAAHDDRSEGIFETGPITFGEDACGRVYIGYESGHLYRFEGPTPASCARVSPSPGTTKPPVSGSLSRPERGGRLLLSAKRLRPDGLRFRVKVRLAPCSAPDIPIQLNRNGKSFSSKHLDHRCRARFLLTVAKPTPLRAFVRIDDEGHHAGSRRLVLMPPRR